MSAEVPKFEYKGKCESCPYVRDTLARLATLRANEEQIMQVLGVDPAASSNEDIQDNEFEFDLEDSTEVRFLDDTNVFDVGQTEENPANDTLSQEDLVRLFMETNLGQIRELVKQGEEILRVGTNGCNGPTLLRGINSKGEIRETYACESPELHIVKTDGNFVKMSDVDPGETIESKESAYIKRIIPPTN